MTKVQITICDMCKRKFNPNTDPMPRQLGDDHPLNKLITGQPNPAPAFEHVCDECQRRVRGAILALVKDKAEAKGGT